MSLRVLEEIRKSDICQRSKYTNRYSIGETMPIVTDNIGRMVAVDFLRPLPKGLGNVQTIFVVVDIFSKYVKLYTVRNPTTENSIDKMRQYFAEAEKPERILTNNGKAFTSRNWQEWMQREGIRHVLIPIRHP